MTLIRESMKFGCNRCGLDLSYDEPKLGMKYSNVTYPEDIHLCSYCAQDVIDFANGKHGNIQTFKSAIAAARESREFEKKEMTRRPVTMTAEQISDRAKKHVFYGNQYILPNRKSRK